MNKSNGLFCNEFHPVNDSYMFDPNETATNNFSECRHCIFKNSHKCKNSAYQNPTYDFFG